jgi:hypothetical protein
MITIFKGSLRFSSLALILMMVASQVIAQEKKTTEEKELELVDFKQIKKVLQEDGLSQEAKKKAKQVEIIKKEQAVIEKDRFLVPAEDEWWGLMTEYWLVKNAPTLAWDFEKPDYGVEESFKTVLQNAGLYQKKFKILFLNTPSLIRAALPGNNGEVIFLISVPFIRTMDLSKLEISLMMLEDFLKAEAGFFKNAVRPKELDKYLGSNFYGKKLDLSPMSEALKNYDQFLTQKGFTFQQQFEITKKMDTLLKPNLEWWNTYYRMLGKIDRLIKTNNQYKTYNQLYPSPEMQIKWLSPDDKVL